MFILLCFTLFLINIERLWNQLRSRDFFSTLYRLVGRYLIANCNLTWTTGYHLVTGRGRSLSPDQNGRQLKPRVETARAREVAGVPLMAFIGKSVPPLPKTTSLAQWNALDSHDQTENFKISKLLLR